MRFLCNLFLLLFLTDILTFAGDEVDLFKVAREGNALQMKGIIKSGEDLKRKDALGRNALMQAVVFGNHETTLVLLANSPDLESKEYHAKNMELINMYK